MIAFLNFLPAMVLIVSLLLTMKFKKLWIMVGGLVTAFAISVATPSYMPKGVIHRSEVPEIVAKDLPIESRNLSPRSGEEYDKKREEEIKKGLPFIK